MYAKFKDITNEQGIGDPIGTTCAPLFTDLYGKLIRTKSFHVWSFSFTNRYIDNLLGFNIPHIAEAVQEIYPPSLDF